MLPKATKLLLSLMGVSMYLQVQESMQGKGSSRRKSVDRMSPAQRMSLRRSIRSHAERDL